jgi:hypothetical protein
LFKQALDEAEASNTQLDYNTHLQAIAFADEQRLFTSFEYLD